MADYEPVRLSLEEAQDLAQYDLTQKMSPFLDPHLLLLISRSIEALGVYKEEDLKQAELALLGETYMYDSLIESYETFGEAPHELKERKQQVTQVYEDLTEELKPLLQICQGLFHEKAGLERFNGYQNLTQLCEEEKIDLALVERLVPYAKLFYECGLYQQATDTIVYYTSIMDKDAEKTVTPHYVRCRWGFLAAKICLLPMTAEDLVPDLINMPEEHREDYYKQPMMGELAVVENLKWLRKFLDEQEMRMSRTEVLLQRSWLLHWSLFAIFRKSDHPGSKLEDLKPELVDDFLLEKNLSIISLSCPHLLRYVAACLILHKRQKKETVWILQSESASYSDPLTRFLLALFIDMDFDEAQQELQKCATVFKIDYFLKDYWPEFEENARFLWFETYCRIHQCIDIEMVATKLHMEAEEAELWIVKLIQSAKLDARIDSEKGRVVMSKVPPSVYQQVIDKTKTLSVRSMMLLSNLDKKEI